MKTTTAHAFRDDEPATKPRADVALKDGEVVEEQPTKASGPPTALTTGHALRQDGAA